MHGINKGDIAFTSHKNDRANNVAERKVVKVYARVSIDEMAIRKFFPDYEASYRITPIITRRSHRE